MKYKLIASIPPVFWLTLALSSIGKPRLAPDYPTWTGEIVLSVAVLVIPIAVVAFLAGRKDAGL